MVFCCFLVVLYCWMLFLLSRFDVFLFVIGLCCIVSILVIVLMMVIFMICCCCCLLRLWCVMLWCVFVRCRNVWSGVLWWRIFFIM